MAKSAIKSTVAGTAFAIRFGDAPAPIERKIGGEKSPYATAMEDMPAPNGNQFANFFVPVPQPDAAITDAGERAKAFNENARKLANSLSGLSRRITKKDATKAFALRKKDENGVLGVVVYRINPSAPKPAAQPATPPAA